MLHPAKSAVIAVAAAALAVMSSGISAEAKKPAPQPLVSGAFASNRNRPDQFIIQCKLEHPNYHVIGSYYIGTDNRPHACPPL